MNRITIFFTMLLLVGTVGMTSCKKAGCNNVNACNYDPDAKADDGTCIDKGQVTFWQDTIGNQYDIVVTVNATEATITTPVSAAPACDFSGSASFSLCPGSHNYTAKEKFPGLKTWTGNVTSLESGCTTILLAD